MLMEVAGFGSVRRSLRQLPSKNAPHGRFFLSTHQFTHREVLAWCLPSHLVGFQRGWHEASQETQLCGVMGS